MKSIRICVGIVFVLSVFVVPAFSQTQLIDEGIYRSYFSQNLREPLYVVYKLNYKQTTECAHDFDFIVTMAGTATGKDYANDGSTYDKGHLANAEDFRGDCDDLKTTYQYFNCVPQNHTMNRGIWKTWEKKIREESEKAPLLIIAGATYKGGKAIGPNSLAVPDYCWKIVYKQSNTKKPIHVLYFPNDASKKVDTTLTVSKLKKKFGYKLKY